MSSFLAFTCAQPGGEGEGTNGKVHHVAHEVMFDVSLVLGQTALPLHCPALVLILDGLRTRTTYGESWETQRELMGP